MSNKERYKDYVVKDLVNQTAVIINRYDEVVFTLPYGVRHTMNYFTLWCAQSSEPKFDSHINNVYGIYYDVDLNEIWETYKDQLKETYEQ